MSLIRPFMIATAIAGSSLVPAIAQEFRIETEVRSADQAEPISENLTIFDDNLIIDFMLKPDRTRFPTEIVVYVRNEKRFVLLDTARKVRAEVIDAELLKILAALQGAPFINDDNRFLFHPEFTETRDPVSGWIELRCPRMHYRLRGERPENEMALPMYWEFIDQFARLNATDPRRMPPFARLELNKAIKNYGIVPEEIELTLHPQADRDDNPLRVSTRHVIMWELSRTDFERVESARRYWMEFAPVSLKEYRQIPAAGETAVADEGKTSRH
jgi:hypothetical protein